MELFLYLLNESLSYVHKTIYLIKYLDYKSSLNVCIHHIQVINMATLKKFYTSKLSIFDSR